MNTVYDVSLDIISSDIETFVINRIMLNTYKY